MSRRGFERLVRKLTKIKSWPALMYIHMYQPFRMKNNFWASAETEMEQILQYYSVPTVSARNALYHLHMNKAHGFAEEDVHCGVHPNPLGHRCGLEQAKAVGQLSKVVYQWADLSSVSHAPP